MTGVYQHSLREKLGQSFYVTVSPEQCLSAYPMEKWNQLTEKFESMPYKDRKRIRSVFSHAAQCDLDAQGRILLPLQLRQFAGLTKNVSVVGAGVTVEIWDADKWAEVDAAETTPESLAEAFEELDF